MKNEKIKKTNLPSTLPILTTVVWLIALDHWGANDIIRGVSYCLIVILWIGQIILMATEDEIDIFNPKKYDPELPYKEKSRFQRKLEKLAEEKGIKLDLDK